MSDFIKRCSRRSFLDFTAKGTQGLLLYPVAKNALASGTELLSGASRVVAVKDDDVVVDGSIDQPTLQIMLDTAVRNLTGIISIGDVWKSLFPGISQSSVISIKVNCINSSLSSHPETAYSVVNGLTAMEVDGSPFPPKNIIIWDRTNNELKRAGYSINTGDTGVKCFGTNQSGVGYSTSSFDVAGRSQRLSTIITEVCDYMINLCTLKNHGTAGVTFSLKNHYGSCNKPGDLHGGYCNPYISALNNLQPIREKQVVSICDAVWGIISGGPGGLPQIMPKSLIMSKDPVAHDKYCSEMLAEYGCKTINRAKHIATSAQEQYSLGTDDPEMIDVVSIENPTVGVREEKIDQDVPHGFRMYQNYPNPFNAQTALSYQLFKPARIQLDVYNIQGALVKRLLDEHQSSGYYRIPWDGRTYTGMQASSGMYFGRFRVDDAQFTIRMQLLK